MTSTLAQKTRRQYSGILKTFAKTVADYKKCANTGDSVAAIQEESITEFDYDDSSSFRLCRSGVLRSILRSERILPLNAEYRN